MQKLYCASAGCGAANLYEIKKPNVCAYCGNPFNSAFKKPVESVAKIKLTVKKIKDDEDYDDEDQETANNETVENLKKIAKASARKVKISMAKNLKTDDLKHLSEKIEREQRNSSSNITE